MNTKYLCVDAFSGAGGLSLGLIEAGFDLIYSFDIDKNSIRTQQKNSKYFRHSVEQLDIREFSTEEFLKRFGLRKGEVTLFAGGPPCQGFSIQRIGHDEDERNNYVHVFVEKIIEINPKFFLLENVPGINGKRGKSILQNALELASENGFRIHKQILDAQDFGIPQRRKRMIIVGERVDNKKEARFKFPDQKTLKVTVSDAISSLPEPPNDGSDHPKIKHHRRDKLSEINLERISYLKPGQGMQHLPTYLLAECHKLGANKIGHRNVYGRMSWDNVAPTITARFDSFTRGQFGHPEQNRSITLREGAILQTFPLDFEFDGNKVDIARQIGNAVPPKLALEIGMSIIEAVEK